MGGGTECLSFFVRLFGDYKYGLIGICETFVSRYFLYHVHVQQDLLAYR